MVDNNNYCACTGDEAQYTIKLNQQGPVGPMGPQGNDGQDGISPQIVVATDTPNEYTLRVVTAFTSFVTPNLMANASEAIEDLDNKVNSNFAQVNLDINNLQTQINTVKDNYVTLDTPQTITAQKTFGDIEASNIDNTNKLLSVNGILLNDTFSGFTVLKTKSSNKQLRVAGENGLVLQGYYGIGETDPLKITFGPYGGTLTIGNSINTITLNTGTNAAYYKGNEIATIVDLENKQDKLVAGDNIKIEDNVISTTGGAELTNPLIFANENGIISDTETWSNGYGLKLVYTKPTNPLDTTLSKVMVYTQAQVFDSGVEVANQNKSVNLLTLNDILAGDNITVDRDNNTGKVTISATDSGGSSTAEKYGIEGDYATHYGILDCPNGLIDYNTTGKEITLNQGVVLQLAGQDNKTTIASDIKTTLTSSTNITLFYTSGELLEVGKIDYSLTEPTDNGVDNYQAWYNPTVGKWQLKSNDTGNVWREVIGTPIANIYLNDSNITRIDYIGYRILDDDILVQQSEIETLNETIATLTDTINTLEARLAALEANINGGNA